LKQIVQVSQTFCILNFSYVVAIAIVICWML